MRAILHIIVTPGDALPEELIARQSETPGQRVTVVDLTSGEGDYREALGAIFEADSVAVW